MLLCVVVCCVVVLLCAVRCALCAVRCALSLLLLLFEESLNVCMATTPKSCKLNEANLHPAAQHLRVDSRRQRQPRGALDEELFIIEGSKNPRNKGLNPFRGSPKNGAKCAKMHPFRLTIVIELCR